MEEERFHQVVRPLRILLAKARSHATSEEDASISKVINELLANIESLKDDTSKIVGWESYVNVEIGNVVKQLDSVLQNNFKQEDFHLQLQDLNKNVSSLKLHTNTLKPPPIAIGSASLSNVTNSALNSGNVGEEQQSRITEIPPEKFDELGNKWMELHLFLTCCLKSFLIFPKNSLIKKTLLIYWWIGGGEKTGINSEIEGKICLQALIEKGFVMASYKSHAPKDIDSCMLHPFVYDKLVQEHNLNYVLLRYPQIPWPFDPISSRLCSSMEDKGYPTEIMQERYDNFKSKSFYFGGLTMCINLNHSFLKFERRRFTEMRKIPVMHLGRWQSSAKHHIEVENTDFLVWLSMFKKLRLLSLRGISRITSLPPFIGLLTKLKILDIRACHNLEELPGTISMLKNLTHLDASECYLLRHMPAGLIKLSKLEVLKGFVFRVWKTPNACELGDLSYLKNLRKLSINIGRNSIIAGGEFSILGELLSLISLTLSWSIELEDGASPSYMDENSTLKISAWALMPPPNLRKLDLRCFPERLAPNWLSPSSLTSLERLYIRGGKLEIHSLIHVREDSINDRPVEENDTVLRWRQVKILRLRYLNGLDTEESELRLGFPNLSHLEIYGCNKTLTKISISE